MYHTQAPQAVRDKALEIILSMAEKKLKQEHVKEVEVQAEEHNRQRLLEKHQEQEAGKVRARARGEAAVHHDQQRARAAAG
jgi:hypothetical protein